MGTAFIRLESWFFLWAIDDRALLSLGHWSPLRRLGGGVMMSVGGFSDRLFGIGSCGECHEGYCKKRSFHDGSFV